MTNTQEPANRKYISLFQEQIDYLQEENHAKTQIIKQLTDMKVDPPIVTLQQLFAVVK